MAAMLRVGTRGNRQAKHERSETCAAGGTSVGRPRLWSSAARKTSRRLCCAPGVLRGEVRVQMLGPAVPGEGAPDKIGDASRLWPRSSMRVFLRVWE